MKQSRKLTALLAMLTAVLFCMTMLTACGASKHDSASGGYTEDRYEPSMNEDYGFGTEEEVGAPEKGDGMDGETVYDRSDVKLIRRASITVEATDFDGACAALGDLVEQVGGYFENTEVYQGSSGSTYRSADYTVRVPADKYNTFLKGVDNDEAFHVTHKNESTEDVGNDYADLEARLKALKTKRDRLNELLEQAENMEDIITIEGALTDTESQIEWYSSDLTRYDRLISYATIKVTVERVSNLSDTVEDPFLSRLSKSFVEGVEDFVEFLQDLALWVAGNILGILFWIIVVLLILAIRRRVIAYREKRGKRSRSVTVRPKSEGSTAEKKDSPADNEK